MTSRGVRQFVRSPLALALALAVTCIVPLGPISHLCWGEGGQVCRSPPSTGILTSFLGSLTLGFPQTQEHLSASLCSWAGNVTHSFFFSPGEFELFAGRW